MDACRTGFVASLKIVLRDASSPKSVGKAWKFAFIARSGWSTFANSNPSTADGFVGCSLHMGSGQRVFADVATMCEAAKRFAKNRSIQFYVGPALPIDEIAGLLYQSLEDTNIKCIPEFCQLAFDRPTDTPGLREHTDLVFVGMGPSSDIRSVPDKCRKMWLSPHLPKSAQHWCASRLYFA